MSESNPYILAFDTANEVIAVGLGVLNSATCTVECVASKRIPAHRASNTRLLPEIETLLVEAGVARSDIASVACGRGPGSFTGVRIAIATAKGMASALEVPLVGVSTLDAIAWQLQMAGYRGSALIVADAMRHEIYPVRYRLVENAVQRLDPDTVVKAEACAQSFAPHKDEKSFLAGDALVKYASLFGDEWMMVPEEMWTCEGVGLLAALQAAWQAGECDPLNTARHDPAFLLPVYTRLSDAEENERKRLANTDPRDLHTGVQSAHGKQSTMTSPDEESESTYVLRPLEGTRVADVAALEERIMEGDAWTAAMVADELPQGNRTWWAAYHSGTDELVAYAGVLVAGGSAELLRVGCAPEHRRRGLARAVILRVADDARALGANELTLEVRASNEGAQALYQSIGLENVGVRPRYYRNHEDAVIMTGPLPELGRDVAGMELFSTTQRAHMDTSSVLSSAQAPLILAIESSCDETAAAIIDGNGVILADTVASQIDFHARFGGVVPEIASRKHVEAICGVTQVCLEAAARRLGVSQLRWSDLDAVACTYAPGLVGALVVGVAFSKAAAWACNKPFIRVNHLEGHLYANKIACPDIKPPMVCSLVSGGHTMLVHVKDWGDYHVLGGTIDDAVGEAFDKVAKALGLGYPGGPIISKLAAQGDPKAIRFPRAMMHSGDLRFSLSGLKTAVITYINQQRTAEEELNMPNIAASFEAAVIDVQVAKAKTALEETGAREFCLGGGVAANPALRHAYEEMCAQMGVRLTMPPASACTDNAAMIALVALDRYHANIFSGLDTDAMAHTNLEEAY